MMKRMLVGALMCAGAAQAQAPVVAPVAVPNTAAPVAAAAPFPTGFQFYGSGEAGALSQQAFHALLAYAKTRVAKRPEDSVVLGEGQPLVKGNWVPCGTKPLAVVFDIDETLVRNLGLEARAAMGEKMSPALLTRWEVSGGGAVDEMPGAGHAIDDLREMGVTVIFNSRAAGMWGKGWFILPNTIYGTALRGGMDDVFPADKRWTDDGAAK